VEVKDMFDKLKRMFEDERATGIMVACAEATDTLCCGGQGIGRGILVPITNQIVKLVFG
jgi:hypothetical protein